MSTRTISGSEQLTIRQSAERLNVSTKTVRRYIADGRLKAARVGERSIRIASDEVDALLRPIPTVGGGRVV